MDVQTKFVEEHANVNHNHYDKPVNYKQLLRPSSNSSSNSMLGNLDKKTYTYTHIYIYIYIYIYGASQ